MVEEKFMKYDKTFHRYSLTIEGCSDICDVTKKYMNEREAIRTLNSISRTVYNFIYSMNATGNKPYVEYLLAKDEELKEVIFEAMRAQLEADISSGYNDIKNQVGINFKTNTSVREDALRSRVVSPEVKNILEPYANRIMTQMYLSRLYPPLPKNRYEEYDY